MVRAQDHEAAEGEVEGGGGNGESEDHCKGEAVRGLDRCSGCSEGGPSEPGGGHQAVSVGPGAVKDEGVCVGPESKSHAPAGLGAVNHGDRGSGRCAVGLDSDSGRRSVRQLGQGARWAGRRIQS